ncbi:hypothetical protein Droror1_Dr00024298 [Drosera rotundifolia]
MDDEHLQAYVVLQEMINQIVAVTIMIVSIFSTYLEVENINYWLEVDRSPIPNQYRLYCFVLMLMYSTFDFMLPQMQTDSLFVSFYVGSKM